MKRIRLTILSLLTVLLTVIATVAAAPAEAATWHGPTHY